MGRARNKRMRTTKKKDYKKIHCTARRRRDIDQIQDDVVNTQAGKPLVFDELTAEDLPGLGQFYCLTCARHFLDDQTLKAHEEGRPHKRRLKDVAQPQYSQVTSAARCTCSYAYNYVLIHSFVARMMIVRGG